MKGSHKNSEMIALVAEHLFATYCANLSAMQCYERIAQEMKISAEHARRLVRNGRTLKAQGKNLPGMGR